MGKIYTGIGSRETPEDVLLLMKKIGYHLGQRGYVLYSGGAEGADMAFEAGCDEAQGIKKIFLPWKGFGKKHGRALCSSDIVKIPDKARETFKSLAEEYKDFNFSSKDSIWNLMSRNMCQVMGEDMETPTSGVICWTPGAEEKGGSRWTIRLAKRNGITVWNLADDRVRRKFESFVLKNTNSD